MLQALSHSYGRAIWIGDQEKRETQNERKIVAYTNGFEYDVLCIGICSSRYINTAMALRHAEYYQYI